LPFDKNGLARKFNQKKSHWVDQQAYILNIDYVEHRLCY